MQLIYLLRTGLLVQTIDILREHRQQLALPFPLGQFFVRSIGAGAGDEHLFAVKAVKLFCMAVKAVSYTHLRIPFAAS